MKKRNTKNPLRSVKKFLTGFLRPIYYSYTSFKIFNLFQKMTGYRQEKRRFFMSMGYHPDIKKPASFNEKVLFKKFYDRNPLLPIIADKYLVRRYLEDVLGKSDAEKILVPLLYVTDRPETICFDSLPQEYIIKPNHASEQVILSEKVGRRKRYTIMHHGKTTVLFDCKQARKEVIDICRDWLSIPFGFRQLEWAYQPIRRKILVEKLLRDSMGELPEDYKFKIFHGKCGLIRFIPDIYSKTNRGYYTPEWKYLDVKADGDSNLEITKKKPENLRSMIDLAELLGKPFDFIRVDLYSIDNNIYFGELTNYPTSGRKRFDPVSFDFKLGSKWKVSPKYWKYDN